MLRKPHEHIRLTFNEGLKRSEGIGPRSSRRLSMNMCVTRSKSTEFVLTYGCDNFRVDAKSPSKACNAMMPPEVGTDNVEKVGLGGWVGGQAYVTAG